MTTTDASTEIPKMLHLSTAKNALAAAITAHIVAGSSVAEGLVREAIKQLGAYLDGCPESTKDA